MKELDRFDRLYELLPPVYRDRDAEQNYPLRDLLRVIGEQVLAVEDDVAQLYDDWFIETCADWAVPYIGDLIGYRPVREAGEAGSAATAAARALLSVLAPRREVASTIGFRRRKGTLAVLEDLAQAITNWPARAAEVTPTMTSRADLLVSVWRLRAFSVTRTRAYRVRGEPGSFRFSILGNDAPLFNRPTPRSDAQQPADDLDLPTPLRFPMPAVHIPEAYYGQDKAFAVYAPNWPTPGAAQPVARELISLRNLGCWDEPPEGTLYVDLELGRLRFPCDSPPHSIRVTYNYGAPMAIGGGEYRRNLSEPAGAIFYIVGKGTKLNAALARWRDEKPAHAVIEITDSGWYPALIDVKVTAGTSLQIRAASGARPVLEIDGTDDDSPGAFIANGEPGGRFTLDGLILVGAPVRVSGPRDDEPSAQVGPQEKRPCAFEVTIRHCTLVPGLSFDHECHDGGEGNCPSTMRDCEKASLELIGVNGRVTIEHSVLGTIRVEQDVVATEPLSIAISDSIVDCAHPEEKPDKPNTWNFEAHHAIFSRTCGHIAHAALRLARCTIFGWVKTHAIITADDCIFTDTVHVARRQLGCMRYCYVPVGSRTPRRYQCQPDVAESKPKAQSTFVPVFMTRDFGQPGYARLALGNGGPGANCPTEIARGAEDESEMGVFHDLFDPQRIDNLQTRINEFIPVDSESSGIKYET